MAKMAKAEQRIPVYRPGLRAPAPHSSGKPYSGVSGGVRSHPGGGGECPSTPKADGTHGAAMGRCCRKSR